jgi:hypothetical protein
VVSTLAQAGGRAPSLGRPWADDLARSQFENVRVLDSVKNVYGWNWRNC